MHTPSSSLPQCAGLMLFLLLSLSCTSLLAQSELDETVPYQGDTLLTNPNQFRVSSEGDVIMDCDWPRMMAMIRDLEERIAGENSTDTVYGQYITGSIIGNVVHMTHDCTVLRDTILALQATYDSALTPRVTTNSPVVLSDSSAILSSIFTGSGVSSTGFKWGTSEILASANFAPGTGTSSPFSDTLMNLLPGTAYYAAGIVVKDGTTLSGDTLAFVTKPGVATDSTSSVTYTAARLHGTYTADSITSQGFRWGALADLSDAVDSIGVANSTDGSFYSDLSDLSEGDTIYYSAFAANSTGTTYGDTLSFSTLTSNKILSTTIAGVSDSTVIIDCSFQGSTVTSMGYKFADNNWSAPLTLNAPDLVTPRRDTIPDDDFSLTFSAAKTYYVHAFVTDGSESISGDTLTFTTLAQVQSSSPTPGYTTVDLAGAVSGESVQSSGFYWSYQSDLTGATDVSVSPVAGEVTYKLTGLAQADTIYFTTYATNDNGDYNYGDTLKVGTRSCTSPTMDDYTYGTALIFEECWLSENLRTSVYRDGSAISKIEADAAWASDSNGGQAIYNNDSTTFYADYGRLYNWYAVNNTKGLCPSGWSVPTKGEYEALIDSLGGASVAAGFLKAAPSDSVAWNGTNDYGFTMVDGGGRLADGGFILQPDNAFLWTASAHPSVTSDAFSINFLASYGATTLAIQDPDQNSGMSVRCIKD